MMISTCLAVLLAVVLSADDYPSVSAAVADCAAKGGGTVTIAKGLRVSDGPVVMRSNVELHLEDGATILFSDDVRKYLPGVPVSWEGIECVNVSPLVYAYGCTNVAITGRGTLKAKMDFWWTWAGERKPDCELVNRKLKNEWSPNQVPVAERQLWREPNARFRPQFIHFNRCRNVRLEGFAVRGTPFWTVHFLLCDGVVARGLDIDAAGDDGRRINNSDGIDVDATRNVLIEDCTFNQGDDALVFKSGKDFDGRRLATPTENVVVRRCTVLGGPNLAAVGSELSGGVRNVRISDCRIVGTLKELLYVKTNPRRGGFVENVTLENIEAEELSREVVGLSARYYFGASGEEAFPEFCLTPIRGITVRNIRCRKARCRFALEGDYLLPVENFAVENVVVGEQEERDFAANVRNLRIDGVPVPPTAAAATVAELGPVDVSAAVWQAETREYLLALTDGTVRGTVVRRSRDRKLWSDPLPVLSCEELPAQTKVTDAKIRRETDGWHLDVWANIGPRTYPTSVFWPHCLTIHVSNTPKRGY